MKVSASVYALAGTNLEEDVRHLASIGIDYFHVDCLDNPQSLEVIERIRAISRLPIDLHLITPRPAFFEPYLLKYRPDFVAFQYEPLPKGYTLPAFDGVQVGLAMETDTPLDAFTPWAPMVQFALFMATTPGRSGGQFDPANFKKIRAFQRLFPSKRVTVDGGVNAEVSFVLRSYGVNTAVVGSYLAQADKRWAHLQLLKYQPTESHFLVSDIMVLPEFLPVVDIASCSARQLLQSNQDFRLGYTLVTNDQGKLVGISTNADIRLALLRKLGNYSQLSPEDLINFKPLTIRQRATVKELLSTIANSPNYISYLPVVDDDNTLMGAVNLHFMLKGEL
ncbi:MAG: CBS domain-containing protein [Bacteroidetes bacterium]|nr:CBS domain-containing protein [Bacteroidota bacterium]